MSDQSYILPRYEETPGVTDVHNKMSNSALEDDHTDNTSPPSQEAVTQAASPPRYTWNDFKKSFFSVKNIPSFSLILQLIAIAVGASFLPDDSPMHPTPLAIWWLSLVGNCVVFKVWGCLKQTIFKLRNEWVNVTDEVKADWIFHLAIDSMLPWLLSATSLGIALLLFKF